MYRCGLNGPPSAAVLPRARQPPATAHPLCFCGRCPESFRSPPPPRCRRLLFAAADRCVSAVRRSFRGPIKTVLGLLQRNYPEGTARILIINTPFAFRAVWGAVKVRCCYSNSPRLSTC